MTSFCRRQCSLLSFTVYTVLGFTCLVEAFVPSTSSSIIFTIPSLPLSSTSTTLRSSISSSSSTTKKKSNQKMKKKKNSGKTKPTSLPHSKRIPGPGRSLSEDELSDHVARQYSTTLSIFDGEQDIYEDDIVVDDDNNNFVEDGPEFRARSTLSSTTNTGANMVDQEAFLRELNARPALVLNADFQPLSYLPLSLWSWQDAIKAVFGGKVQVVDVYPDISVRAANIEVPLPSVIALTEYVQHKNQRPAFTRRNVFLRDEYKCQYCGGRFHTADLSLDHVHPRCKGGLLTWDNAVTSCLKCNGRKGSMPVTELRSIGMRLIREPSCPTQMELAAKAARMVPRRVHMTWKPFIGITDPRGPKKQQQQSSSSSSAATQQKGTMKTTNKDTPMTAATNAVTMKGDEDCIDDRYFDQPQEQDDEVYFSES